VVVAWVVAVAGDAVRAGIQTRDSGAWRYPRVFTRIRFMIRSDFGIAEK
jgi:hypothetical protein